MKKGRKITGGKYKRFRKRRLYEKDSQERQVTLGKIKKKTVRTMGGHLKYVLLNSNEANVLIKDGEVKKVQIKNVAETPQNKFLARQNRLMKGAVIDTTLGKARITNRPTREGIINAVLVE